MTYDLKKLIETFEKEVKPKMMAGEAYYKSKNIRILERIKEFYNLALRKTERDWTKANNLLPSTFYKPIVKQKINYSINKGLTIQSNLYDKENKLDPLNKVIDIDEFKKKLKKIGKNASNKIYGLIQWYFDNEELKYKLLPSEQCILIYNDDDNEILEVVIRYYKENETIKAQIINKDNTLFMIDKDGTWVKDTSIDNNPQAHLLKTKEANGNVVDETTASWGRVPISVLYNNDIRQTDLSEIKSSIDMYDIINSDFGNNFEDYQEMYWILKNYQGQDAAAFMEEFKKSRILKVGEDGDAKQETQEVPYEARISYMKSLRKDIYEFAMAVDPNTISGDSTNLTIKALFSNLDLKANDFEDELDAFILDMLYFVNKYSELKKGEKIEKIEVSYNRAIILNKTEIIERLLKQIGFRPLRKLYEEHPDVEDVDEELKLMAEEEQKNIDSFKLDKE